MSAFPASPLRYPGGKGRLASLLASIIDLNDLRGSVYYEPCAGGAGAALNLLRDNIVSEIFLNDADPRISAFWNSALRETDRFIDWILNVPLDIDEWDRQREICANPRGTNTFELGTSTFYMNRCNRSGVLKGAGPIGGRSQSGKWRLDVRFNRESLALRIHALGRLSNYIHVSNLDAMDFLKQTLPQGIKRRKCIVYLDPPYINKSGSLYLNSYKAQDHRDLATYMNAQKVLPWVMTYDNTELVRTLYEKQVVTPIPIRYSLNSKKTASELLIVPKHITLPHSCTYQTMTAI